VALDWSCAPLADGLACYRTAQFFEAHEHWEAVWLTLREPEKSFLQSLIQVSAAFHHLEAGNRKGAASLLSRAFKRLALCPAAFGGIDVESLRKETRLWLQVIEAGLDKPATSYPAIQPIKMRLE
jgi:Uncharacterized conserved protein